MAQGVLTFLLTSFNDNLRKQIIRHLTQNPGLKVIYDDLENYLMDKKTESQRENELRITRMTQGLWEDVTRNKDPIFTEGEEE